MVRADEVQRWSQLRLIVDRGVTGHGWVALNLREQRGRQRRDVRLAVARIELSPGDPASRDALEALRLAVEALREGAG